VACEAPAHSPAGCDEREQWAADCAGLRDVLTHRMLMQNYKRCPKCGVYLERTAGCNHMVSEMDLINLAAFNYHVQ
jgi:E3 ubiquitin-protein ligase RNF144